MTQLAQALHCKPEVRCFGSRWVYLDFPLIYTCRPPYGPVVDSSSNRNGGKDGRCVGLTALPASCADFLKIQGASNSCSPESLSRSAVG